MLLLHGRKVERGRGGRSEDRRARMMEGRWEGGM